MNLLAAEYAKLGRLEDAQEMVERIMKFWPGANLQVMDQNILKHYLKRPEDLENYVGALRLAGFPEWPFGAEGRPEDRLSEDELRAQWSDGNVTRGTFEWGVGPVEFVWRTGVDGRYEIKAKFGEIFSDFDAGIEEIRDGMFCVRSDVYALSRSLCGYVYRNPEGSNDGNDAYILIGPFAIVRYSVETKVE